MYSFLIGATFGAAAVLKLLWTSTATDEVHELQAQLAASKRVAPARYECIFFPDKGMPCRNGPSCRRQRCSYVHEATGLTRFLSYLTAAQRQLDICVFTLTCNEIADAILAVHKRGVRVRIITDDDQMNSTGSDISQLAQAGIPVRHDGAAPNMHHKFAVVDARHLLTGSFNYTRQAVLNNQENVLIVDDPAIAAAYGRHFDMLWNSFSANVAR